MEKSFHFQALNQDGRMVSGTVTGATQEEARNKLSAKGLAILSIEEQKGNLQIPIGAQKKEENIGESGTGTIYEFKCQDANGKPAQGTIQTEELYEAFHKLRSQYQKVVYIVPKDASPNEKKLLRFNGIDPEFEERFQEEQKTKKQPKKEVVKKTREEQVTDLVQKKEKEFQLIRIEIQDIINKVTDLLQKKGHLLKPEKKREIEDKINLLLRLKMSNSIEHLKTLTHRILEELAADANFIDQADLPEDAKAEHEAQKQAFRQNVNTHVKQFDRKLRSIQLKLSGLDAESLKQSFGKLQIAENVLTLLYWIFAILAVYFAVFWLFTIGKYFLGIGAEKVNYYFDSGTLWYFTIVSASIAYYFGWFHFRSSRLQWYHLAGYFVAFMLFSLEFSVIFAWL